MSQTLARGLQILELLSDKPLSVGELADDLGVHHSTALRLLHTLHSFRFVEIEPDRKYRLGSGIAALGQQVVESIDLRAVALPHMRELSRLTNETVHLGLLESDNVVYIEKVEAIHPVRMYSRIGKIAPIHCTGIAKAIVAFLPETKRDDLLRSYPLVRYTPNTLLTAEAVLQELTCSRHRGWAYDNQEHETGIHCIAAPIRDSRGAVGASVSVSAPASRIDRKTLLSYVDTLVAAAAAISSDIGWRR